MKDVKVLGEILHHELDSATVGTSSAKEATEVVPSAKGEVFVGGDGAVVRPVMIHEFGGIGHAFGEEERRGMLRVLKEAVGAGAIHVAHVEVVDGLDCLVAHGVTTGQGNVETNGHVQLEKEAECAGRGNEVACATSN